MRTASLELFIQAAQHDAALQARLRSTQSLAEVVQVAQAAGYAVKAAEMQLWAHCKEFDAAWWPWAGLKAEARAAFFRR